jgi:hypothetical protein
MVRKVLVFFNLYLPFYIAIAAGSPIEERGLFLNYTGLHKPRDHPAGDIRECRNHRYIYYLDA